MDVAGTVVEMGSKVKSVEKRGVIVDPSLTNVPQDSQLSEDYMVNWELSAQMLTVATRSCASCRNSCV